MAEHPADRAGLAVLPFDVCLQLLASAPVGRIGFFADGEVVILPVVVTGRAEVVYDEAEVERLGRRGLHPWVSGRQTPRDG
jgi:hypothetical protein